MTPNQTPFTGNWNIVALEFNIAGEWYQEFTPEPGGWCLCFSEQGFFGQKTAYPVGIIRGTWSVDDKGIISILYNSTSIDKCVFREEGRGTYLYMYDDQQHIVPDPAVIVRHHANSRYKLERSDSVKSGTALPH